MQLSKQHRKAGRRPSVFLRKEEYHEAYNRIVRDLNERRQEIEEPALSRGLLDKKLPNPIPL